MRNVISKSKRAWARFVGGAQALAREKNINGLKSVLPARFVKGARALARERFINGLKSVPPARFVEGARALAREKNINGLKSVLPARFVKGARALAREKNINGLKSVLPILLLFLSFSAFGQCRDYPCVIQKVKKAIETKKYTTAFEQLESAEGYEAKNPTEITALRKKLFDAIEKEKEDAKKAKEEAEAERQKAKNAEAKVQAQLNKIKAANQNLIKPLVNLFDTYLYQMEYGAADSILMQAIEIDESLNKDGRTAFTDGLMQLIYFYTECGRQNETPLHAKHLDKALNLCEKLKTYDESYRHYTGGDKLAFLNAVLEKYCPEKRRQALYYRYYPRMIEVKGDTFAMKDEEGRVAYTAILSDYDIAETELTVNQYFLFCEASGYSRPESPPSWGWRGDNPMVYISWGDCAAYMNWLTEQENLLKGKKNQPVYTYGGKAEWEWKTMGYCDDCGSNDKNIRTDSVLRKTGGYRFPTEAEWQFAAAGGKEGASLNLEYSGSNDLDSVAWYGSNSESHTHAVGTKNPNKLGLYDMSGNVWEWCQDWYKGYPAAPAAAPLRDFCSDISGDFRVLRGGCWYYDDFNCRVARRLNSRPDYRLNDDGFRPARTR